MFHYAHIYTALGAALERNIHALLQLDLSDREHGKRFNKIVDAHILNEAEQHLIEQRYHDEYVRNEEDKYWLDRFEDVLFEEVEFDELDIDIECDQDRVHEYITSYSSMPSRTCRFCGMQDIEQDHYCVEKEQYYQDLDQPEIIDVLDTIEHLDEGCTQIELMSDGTVRASKYSEYPKSEGVHIVDDSDCSF